jgi:2-dehydropantoate 2-reductase
LKPAPVNIVVFGAGVQGTLYGVRFARAGHAVSLVARGARAAELRAHGAVLEAALDRRPQVERLRLPVSEGLRPQMHADLCLVTVRREQLEAALPELTRASWVARFLIMGSHVGDSQALFAALGRERVVQAFPGFAGTPENGTIRYVEIAQRPTALDGTARDVCNLLRHADLRYSAVHDMESWLRRNAVFLSAVFGALYLAGADARRLGGDATLVETLILAVREGWAALDARRVGPPTPEMNAIFRTLPLAFARTYWRELFTSARGDYYFARHARRSASEAAAVADDVLALLGQREAPYLRLCCAAIARAAGN